MNTTDNSSTSTGSSTRTDSTVAIPEKWSDVDPTLIPLFEAGLEWFEAIYEQFYFSAGGVGQLCDLSPDGVEFHQCYYKDEHRGLRERYAKEGSIGNATVVRDRETARDSGEQATWLNCRDKRVFWIHEYVPFESRVTTPDDLESGLSEIMHATPDFDELFMETESVSNDLFGV